MHFQSCLRLLTLLIKDPLSRCQLLLGLLLEELVLQLIRQSHGVLWCIRLGEMNVSFSSSSSVEVLALHAWA